MAEPRQEVDELAHAVIGAAIEVHRELGPGFLEAVYEEALGVEMTLRGIPFARQAPTEVYYKGVLVGFGRMDILVGLQVVVEIKAAERILPIHRAQVISYLKTTGLPLGLPLNFGCLLMKDGVERIVRTR